MMPKRLIVLIFVYIMLAIALFITQTGVIAGVLLIVLSIAMIGKQKAALNMLRAFSILQGLTLSVLPFVLSQQLESISQLLQLPSDLMFSKNWDFAFISIASALCAIQIWLGFNKKVISWFSIDNNMNIMK